MALADRYGIGYHEIEQWPLETVDLHLAYLTEIGVDPWEFYDKKNGVRNNNSGNV